jgi:hypothetical protein
MMELDGNVLRWLDMHLVRRQAGSGRADDYGLGYVDTPTRAAHAVQYEAMLAEMVTGAPGRGFAAADRFDVLPPMGRMPAASIAARAPAPGQTPVLSQTWLPAEVPVELTALPEDEVRQHLAESLSMPPIDLQASAAELAQTPVTVIVPIPRADWVEAPLEIREAALSLRAAKPLGAPANTPGELIRALLATDTDDILDAPAEETAWRQLLSGRQTLWYMRRRQVLRTDDLAGRAYAFQTGTRPGEEENGDRPSNTGGGGTEGPRPIPPDFPAILRPVLDPVDVAVRDHLAPYGLPDLYQTIRTAETRDGFEARATLGAFLLRAAGLGSGLALTEIVRRAVEVGDLSLEEMTRITRAIPLEAIGPRYTRMEALIIGGPVRFRVASFRGRSEGPSINGNTARALNGGVSVRAVERPRVPDDMDRRTQDVLSALDMPDVVIEATLRAGSGEIPLPDPRDLDLRRRLLETAAEAGVPLVGILDDPGSVEAQTRRNLLYRTGTIPVLMEALAEAEPGANLVGLAEHMDAMDNALRLNTGNGINLATRGVETLLSGLR